MLADFPGTKLYLILEDELARGDPSWDMKRRARLLPLHRAPRIVYASADDTIWTDLRRELYQLRFTLFRMRFHVVQGLRYLIEASVWEKRRASLQAVSSRQIAKDSYTTES